MRALIVYSSWFGHTRLVASALTEELEARGYTVVCASADKVEPSEVFGYAILLLGSHAHTGHASRRLVELCEAIPHRRLNRMAIGVFGTQDRPGEASSLDELVTCLEERGCMPALPPLRFERFGGAAILPEHELDAADLNRVREFAAEIAEVAMPVQIG